MNDFAIFERVGDTLETKYFFYILLLFSVYLGLNFLAKRKHKIGLDSVQLRAVIKRDIFSITVLLFVVFWGFGASFFKLFILSFFALGFYFELLSHLENKVYKILGGFGRWVVQKWRDLTTIYKK